MTWRDSSRTIKLPNYWSENFSFLNADIDSMLNECELKQMFIVLMAFRESNYCLCT